MKGISLCYDVLVCHTLFIKVMGQLIYAVLWGLSALQGRLSHRRAFFLFLFFFAPFSFSWFIVFELVDTELYNSTLDYFNDIYLNCVLY